MYIKCHCFVLQSRPIVTNTEIRVDYEHLGITSSSYQLLVYLECVERSKLMAKSILAHRTHCSLSCESNQRISETKCFVVINWRVFGAKWIKLFTTGHKTATACTAHYHSTAFWWIFHWLKFAGTLNMYHQLKEHSKLSMLRTRCWGNGSMEDLLTDLYIRDWTAVKATATLACSVDMKCVLFSNPERKR